jgi:hypothetical protein
MMRCGHLNQPVRGYVAKTNAGIELLTLWRQFRRAGSLSVLHWRITFLPTLPMGTTRTLNVLDVTFPELKSPGPALTPIRYPRHCIGRGPVLSYRVGARPRVPYRVVNSSARARSSREPQTYNSQRFALHDP